MTSIVVTGSTGFIGTALVPHLQSLGYSVIEVNRNAKKNGYTYQDLVQTIPCGTCWIHMAGVSKDRSKKSLEKLYQSVNVELTKKVFEAFLKDEASKTFIFMSSIKAAASCPHETVLETSEFKIDAPYGTSKKEAEEWLNNQPLPQGKKLIILRPVMVFGKQKSGNLFGLYRYIKKGLPYPLASINNRKSFLSLENLLFVFEQIIGNPDFPSGLYNVCDSQEISTNEIVRLMYELNGMRNRSLRIPMGFFKAICAIGGKLNLPVNPELLSKLTGDYIVSNERLLSAMNCELPHKTQDKIIETINWFGAK